MTAYTSTTVPVRPASPRSTALLGAGTALVATGWAFYGAHTWVEIAVTTVAAVVVAALVYGVVVPWALRRESAGWTALALSVPAVLLLWPAFWSGLPLVLGVAGVLVGNAGRTARSGAWASITGMALGALAATAYLAIYVVDGVLLGHVGFLLG